MNKFFLLKRAGVLCGIFIFLGTVFLYAQRPRPYRLRSGRARSVAGTSATRRYNKRPKNSPPLSTGHTSVKRTKADWLAQYQAHPEDLRRGTPMYGVFRRVSREVEKLRETNPNAVIDPVMKEMATIWSANTTRKRTAEEWLAQYKEHPEELRKGTQMYNAFLNVSLHVKKIKEADPNAVIDPMRVAMVNIWLDATERRAKVKTTEEVYDIFLQYLQDKSSYPTRNDWEYKVVYNRLHGWNKPSLSDVQAHPGLRHLYENDPELNKLYQLDELARAVRDGQKPWAAVESELHRDFTNLAEKDQQTLLQMDAHYEQVWTHFPEWYEQNKPYIIVTSQTSRVFAEILSWTSARARGAEDTEIVQILSDLSRMKLGDDGNGVIYRVIYRGNLSGAIRAEDFHLVAEEQGVALPTPFHQIFPQRLAHINFWFEDGRLAGIDLKEDVTPQDVQHFVDSLLTVLGPGWTARMGEQEPGRQKIYLEQINNKNGLDRGFVLQIKVKAPGLRQRRKEDPNFFPNLFGKYYLP